MKESDTNEVAECYFCIGWNSLCLGNLNKAIEAYEISLRIGTKLFGYNNIKLAKIYDSIGSVY